MDASGREGGGKHVVPRRRQVTIKMVHGPYGRHDPFMKIQNVDLAYDEGNQTEVEPSVASGVHLQVSSGTNVASDNCMLAVQPRC